MGFAKKGVSKAIAMLLVAATVFYVQADCNLTPAATVSNEVICSEVEGWLESAYVKWAPVTSASGYNVYYKVATASDSTYVQLDNELIRQYTNYVRADVLGLKKGNYVIKIVPLFDNKETTSMTITQQITVSEHVREGFAFASQSPMGTGSGGYQNDGTVASNAQIIYVTKDTVNTLTLDVITSSSGSTTKATGLVDVLTKRQKGYDKRPLIIRLIGKISASDINGLNSSGYLQVKGCYNLTLEGVGQDATCYGWGLLIRDAHNVEVRNLGFMLFPDDGISLDTNNENIWVHNNDIFYGSAGSDADQAKGDGSCDVKGFSTYVTVSYNHFFDSGKSSLCGMSDSKEFFVTYHHNWFDHSDSRHPRVRVGTIHIYNNYFDGNSKYGVGVTKGSSVFVEANYFRNCKYPMLSSLQGTDIYGGNVGTFSGEAGGMIKAYNNTILGATRLVYAQEDGTQFDAYQASSRNEQVPSTYKTVSGGTTYNNFDTNSSVMYQYTPDAPDQVVAEVTSLAGRLNGGDFKFTFNNAVDDTLDSMNTVLMSAIKSYTSDLVKVGGNSMNTGNPTVTPQPTVVPTATPQPTVAPTATPQPTVAPTTTPLPTVVPTVTPTITPAPTVTPVPGTSYEHNFTTDGLTSSYYAIQGNLSTSKGTVGYNGLTLTTCLKMESSTKIAFTTDTTSTLKLVFNEGCNLLITIDGTDYTIANGILELNLAAGSHTVTKRDTNVNLYYVSLRK